MLSRPTKTVPSHNGHWKYDQNSGRYLQSNPMGFRGGLGLYVYGLNSPLMHIDPTGLMPPPIKPFESTEDFWGAKRSAACSIFVPLLRQQQCCPTHNLANYQHWIGIRV